MVTVSAVLISTKGRPRNGREAHAERSALEWDIGTQVGQDTDLSEGLKWASVAWSGAGVVSSGAAGADICVAVTCAVGICVAVTSAVATCVAVTSASNPSNLSF